jgi:hypothetical protein
MQAVHEEREVAHPHMPGHVPGPFHSMANNLQEPSQGCDMAITEQAQGGVDVEVDEMEVDDPCPPETPAEDAHGSQPHPPAEHVAVDESVHLRTHLIGMRASSFGQGPEVRSANPKNGGTRVQHGIIF